MAVDVVQTLITLAGAAGGALGGVTQSARQLRVALTAHKRRTEELEGRVTDLTRRLEDLDRRLRSRGRASESETLEGVRARLDDLDSRVGVAEATLEELVANTMKSVQIPDFEAHVREQVEAWRKIERELGGIQATLGFLRPPRR